MKSITLHDKTFVPYIMNDELEKAIDKVADRLNDKHSDDGEPVILLCVLNGAIMFTSELMKRLKFPLELMSVKLSSYEGTRCTGSIRVDLDITRNIAGRKVIICEDIVDTGNTIRFLHDHLKNAGASEVEICTMLLKPDVYDQKDLCVDYAAMEIPPRFIVGFGLDYDQIGRNLKDIYVLE